MSLAAVDARGPTEFHRVFNDFRAGELRNMADEYPLTTLITLVAFTILGVSCILSIFSPTVVISGATLLALTAYLAMTIKKDSSHFWKAIKASFVESKNYFFTAKKKAETGS